MRPRRRAANSKADSCHSVPIGRTRKASKVPALMCVAANSTWLMNMSPIPKARLDMPNRNATSPTDQPPSELTRPKMTAIARKSAAPTKIWPARKRKNDVRYCRSDRSRAPTSRRYTYSPLADRSPTLDHQLLRGACEQHPTDRDERDQPRDLQREHSREVRSRVFAEEHLDRELDHRRERQRARDCFEPGRKKHDREVRTGEELRGDPSDLVRSPYVQDPERQRLQDEPIGAGDAHRECGRHEEGEERLNVRRQPKMKHEGAQHVRRDAPKHEVERRLAVVHRQPPALEVIGTAEIDGHVAGADAFGHLEVAEDADDHQQALRHEHVRHRVGGVETADAPPLVE